MSNALIRNIDKLHTTEMGMERIKRNLGLTNCDAVEWCRTRIMNKSAAIERQGKNWMHHYGKRHQLHNYYGA